MENEDPHNLERFVQAQEGSYERALEELKQGDKRSHWIWYILPQLIGLGSSSTAEKYGIHSLDEAKAYLAHPVLGPRLIECCRALLAVEGKSASHIMGYPDDLKLRSSATLFSIANDDESDAAETHPEFRELLEKYYNGEPDHLTLERLTP